MTADDLLFEPFNTVPTTGTSTPVTGNGIVSIPGYHLRVEVNRGYPKKVYLDAAKEVMDFAVIHHPNMSDVRNCKYPLPPGSMNLIDIVDRFYDGDDELWVGRPQAMPPQQFHFQGRFGHFKFWRMPQQFIPSQTVIWFWLDTGAGQLAAIDLGLLCMHPSLKMYHAFRSQGDATNYFRS